MQHDPKERFLQNEEEVKNLRVVTQNRRFQDYLTIALAQYATSCPPSMALKGARDFIHTLLNLTEKDSELPRPQLRSLTLSETQYDESKSPQKEKA